jgi:hypothetical protein
MVSTLHKLMVQYSILLMFEIFLVSSWDIRHSQFGIQNQILVSRGYQDTANFRPPLQT